MPAILPSGSPSSRGSNPAPRGSLRYYSPLISSPLNPSSAASPSRTSATNTNTTTAAAATTTADNDKTTLSTLTSPPCSTPPPRGRELRSGAGGSSRRCGSPRSRPDARTATATPRRKRNGSVSPTQRLMRQKGLAAWRSSTTTTAEAAAAKGDGGLDSVGSDRHYRQQQQQQQRRYLGARSVDEDGGGDGLDITDAARIRGVKSGRFALRPPPPPPPSRARRGGLDGGARKGHQWGEAVAIAEEKGEAAGGAGYLADSPPAMVIVEAFGAANMGFGTAGVGDMEKQPLGGEYGYFDDSGVAGAGVFVLGMRNYSRYNGTAGQVPIRGKVSLVVGIMCLVALLSAFWSQRNGGLVWNILMKAGDPL